MFYIACTLRGNLCPVCVQAPSNCPVPWSMSASKSREGIYMILLDNALCSNPSKHTLPVTITGQGLQRTSRFLELHHHVPLTRAADEGLRRPFHRDLLVRLSYIYVRYLSEKRLESGMDSEGKQGNITLQVPRQLSWCSRPQEHVLHRLAHRHQSVALQVYTFPSRCAVIGRHSQCPKHGTGRSTDTQAPPY
jgi:hypothetical protein